MAKEWGIRAIMAKSEENRLWLKVNFKYSRGFQNLLGGFLVPCLKTMLFLAKKRYFLAKNDVEKPVRTKVKKTEYA